MRSTTGFSQPGGGKYTETLRNKIDTEDDRLVSASRGAQSSETHTRRDTDQLAPNEFTRPPRRPRLNTPLSNNK